jgi:F0F1-type ATP synthase epsilon subunit
LFNLSVYDIKTALPFFNEMVSTVVLPGEEGQLSVWDFHQAMLTCLKEGEVVIDKSHFIPIKQGVAKMDLNRLVLFVDKKNREK